MQRVWWISYSLGTSSALDIWQSTFSQTCGRRSWRPARYLSSSTHSHISKRRLATALRLFSSNTTGHYVLNKDVDPKRLGSENYATKEAQQARTKWHRWHGCSSTCSSKLYLFFFMKCLFCVCRRSVEVLVYPSTWTNLNKVESGTNDRHYLSSLIVL